MEIRNILIWVLIVVSLACVRNVCAQDDYALPDTNETYRFNRGDGFRLMIYEADLNTPQNRFISNYHNRDYALDGEGYVRMGPMGEIKIAGLTVEETTEKLEKLLQPYARTPNIIVVPLIRVNMIGEFGKSGMYRFDPSASFWDVVSEAGGVGSSIRLEDVYIMRGGEIIYKDFRDALYKGTSLKEMGIQSGDEIIAPRINRLSLYDIFRYVNFISTLLLLYYTIQDRTK